MTQIINLGVRPNDGTGDALRIAFEKCNTNLSEVADGSVNVLAYIPTQFHAGIRERTITTDIYSYLQVAVDETAAARKALYFPAGLYPIAPAATSGPARGLWLKDGSQIFGDGVNSTIIKNINPAWFSVISLRGGNDIQIRNMTIDGDWPNMPSGSAIRPVENEYSGVGILFWNPNPITAGYNRLLLENLLVKNTAGYGIGVENSYVNSGFIHNIWFENIGIDGIDMKENMPGGVVETKRLIIDGIFMDTPGRNTVSSHDNSCVVDVAGPTMISNVFVTALNSFGTKMGNSGVRLRSHAIQPNEVERTGAPQSMMHNINVKGAKLPGEGSLTLKQLIGIEVEANNCHISNVTVDNCYWGVYHGAAGGLGESIPDYCSFDNITAINCTGAANDGYGIMMSAATTGAQFNNIHVLGCNYGMWLVGGRHTLSNYTAEDCTVAGLKLTNFNNLNQYNISCLQFNNNAAEIVMHVDDAARLVAISPSSSFRNNMMVTGARNVYYDVYATANDANWSVPDNEHAGGIRIWTEEAGAGAGPGKKGGFYFTANGANGANFHWQVATSSALENDITVARFFDYRTNFYTPVVHMVYQVADLPSAATIGTGGRAFVTNSDRTLTVAIGTPVADGGTNRVPVYSDGTVWKVG